MARYKQFPAMIVRVIFGLTLLFLVVGIRFGTAQTIEREQAAVSIVPDNQGVGAPGSTVIYQHTVKNLGGVTDTFDLTAVSNHNWSTNVSPEMVTLLSQQQTTILVTIVVAVNAPLGTVDTTVVTATSQKDPGVSDEATDTTLVPIPMYLPIVSNNAGEPAPDCQLTPPPSGNPSGVDLIVTAVSLNPNPPQAGQPTTVRVTVKNQGTANVMPGNNFYIDFYDKSLPQPPQQFELGDLFWGVQGADFTAGKVVTLVSSYTFNNPGFHYLYAQIDTGNEVAEANENNNIYGCLGLTIN